MNALIHAVRCHRFAGTDDQGKPLAEPEPLRGVLSLDEIPAPACRPDHVLIRTHYAGIQYPDALQAQGLYQDRPPLPYIPGMDVSGTVLEIGSGVQGLEVGDRVIAQLIIGGLAELIVAPKECVWKAPAGVCLSKCANIARNYFAAYHSLKVIGEFGPPHLVLVDGASGGVGMAAVALAKAMGGKVIAAVSTPDKGEYPQQAGADRVLFYGRDRDSYRQFKSDVRRVASELGHPAGVDLVIDMVQGDLFEAALLSSIRPLGRICLVGFTAGQKPIRPGMVLIKQAAVVGSMWGAWAHAHPQDHQQHVAEILGFFASGAVQPRVDRIFPLKDYVQAFELFENNQGRGNTVICFHEESSD